MAYTLTGMTSLGTVTSERSNKDAQLFQMPIPRTDSNKLIALDIFGVQRTINIDGVYTTTDGTIATFISQLDDLVNGIQTSKTYASDTSGTSYTVFVQTAEWKREPAEVVMISYSISMLEAEQVTV